MSAGTFAATGLEPVDYRQARREKYRELAETVGGAAALTQEDDDHAAECEADAGIAGALDLRDDETPADDTAPGTGHGDEATGFPGDEAETASEPEIELPADGDSTEESSPAEPDETGNPVGQVAGDAESAALLDQIEAAECEVAAVESRWLAAKETAKELGKLYDGKVLDLRALIRKRRADAQAMPLFRGDAPAAPSSVETTSEATDAPSPMAEANPDAWKDASINDLNLPGSSAHYLANAGIETIGELEKRRGKPDWWKSIEGIGKGKAEKIIDLLLKYHEKNRDAAAFASAGAATGEASDETTGEVVDV